MYNLPNDRGNGHAMKQIIFAGPTMGSRFIVLRGQARFPRLLRSVCSKIRQMGLS